MKVDVRRRARAQRSQIQNQSGWLNTDQIFRRTCLSAMLAACFDMAAANPTGPQVVHGLATFNNAGNTLSVTNTPNTIIDWASFSINPGELTRFIQQNANSSVLNRIGGQNPSQILGALQSNGKVFLINPNGVLFGAGSQIDVNGLVASSLNLSNNDFLNGKLNFSQAAISGNVSNKGAITTPAGGQVFLIAPNVDNSGIITAPNGQVILAAGHTVQLVDSGNPDLHVVVSSPADQAINLGSIVAQAGKIGIYGALVRQRGVVNAGSAVIGANGKVVLKASRDSLLEAGSLTSAQGAGSGGTVEVLGQRVGLLDDARVDASGNAGGGTVLLGGDYQGRNAAVPNAQFTYVSPQASVRADARQSGDGGKVIAWADQGTQVYGSIDARGGVAGGSGGLVETSGKLRLDVDGAFVRAAARGNGAADKNGQWLLDPSDVTVTHGATGSLSAGVFDPPSSSSIGDTQINTALAGGTDVTIQTSGGTGGTGLIRVNGNADSGGAVDITNRGGGTRSLTLTTSGAIDIRSGASIAGQNTDPLNVTLNATGGITINGTIDNMGGATSLTGATSLGGKIKNATLSSANTLTGGTGTLDGVTISGTLGLAGGMYVENDLTLANGAVLNLGNGSLYLHSGGTQHFASSGSGTINLAGGTIYGGYYGTGQTLQIDSGVTLQGYGGVYDSNPATLVNNGAIIANTPSQTFALSPSSLTNAGSLKANAGSMNLGHINWSNSGSMAVASGATLNLQFDTTTAGLGSVSRSGGTVNYSGVLDNSNGTLDIGGSGPFGSGGLSNLSGTIKSGSITSGDSSVLAGSGGTLDNVTVLGTLGLSGSLFVQNSITLGNAATLNLGNSSLYFKTTGAQHVASGGTSTINSAGATIYSGYSVNGQTLELDSGVTLQGYGGLYDSSPATVKNSGTINANASGQTFTLGPTNFTNAGSLQASAGILTVNHVGWSNSGSMAVSGSGRLNLNMDTTTAGLGTVTRSGGSVYFNGILDNSSATLDIGGSGIFGSGGLSGIGGTIKNGTVVSSDSTVLAGSFATLDGVTVGGTLAASGSLGIKHGLTLAGGATLNLGNTSVYFQDSGTGHVATPGNATINLAGATLYAGYGVTGQTLQIDSGMTLQGYGGLYDSTAATVINAGTINAGTPSQTFTIGPTSFNNTGTLQASSGTLTIGHIGWNNSGSMSVGSGGILNLNMDTTSAALGSVTRSGGSVNLNGVLDNTSSVLDIGGGGLFGAGGLTHLGGSIKNGTLKSGDSTVLNMNGKLDGVTVSGSLGVGGSMEVLNGLTLANGASLNLGNTSVYFESGGIQHIASPGSATVNMAGSTVYAGYGVTGQTLQIDSGITVQGYGYLGESQVATINNAGTISATDPSQVLTIMPGSFNNSGTLRAAGQLTVGHTGWSNTGTVAVAPGGIFNAHMDTTTAGLGTITRTGGSINYGGVLDNTGATLDIGGGGQFGSGGLSSLTGTIKNGTVVSGDSTVLTASGATLDGVTFSGNLGFAGSAYIKNGVTLANASTLNLGTGYWYFTDGGTEHVATPGSATMNLAAGVWYGGYGVNGQTLQIDSGVTLAGYGILLQSSAANLVNNGTINSNLAGHTLSLGFTGITNNGTLRADAGTLSLTGFSTNSGVLSMASGATINNNNAGITNNAGGVIRGSGTLDVGSGTLTNNGSIEPGGAGTLGTLNIHGNFVQGSTGNLAMEAGPTASDHDVLAISGTAALNGSLTMSVLSGYNPANGDQFPLLTYTGNASGTFATINAAAFTGATPDYSGNGSFLLKMPNGTVINIWNFDGNGNWNDPTKWSLGHVPTVNEDVQVPDYSSQFTVSIAANAQLAKSVVFAGNDKLAVSGGSLSVTNASNLSSGTLDLSASGIYNSGGNLSVKALNMSGTSALNLGTGVTLSVFDHAQSGGSITGVANVVIANSYNRSGGTFAGSLSGLDITQTSGNLTPGALSVAGQLMLRASNGDITIDQPLAAPGASISLAAPQGAIANGGGSLTAPVLVMSAQNGIGHGTPLATSVSALQAVNTGSGDIAIQNAITNLALTDVTSAGYAVKQQGSGKIDITGGANGLVVHAPVVAAGGDVNLNASTIVFDNSSSAKVDAGNGNVLLRASGAGGIVMPAASSIKINGSGVASTRVQLEADSLTLAGSIDAGLITGTGYVDIAPVSTVPLVVETGRGGGHLSLAPTDLGHISASGLSLTNYNGSAGVTFADALGLSAVQNLQVFTNGAIAVDAPLAVSGANGYINLVPTGGNLTLGANGTVAANLITVQQAHVLDLNNAGAASFGVSGGNVLLLADHVRLGSNAPLNLGSNGALKIGPNNTATPIDIVSAPNVNSSNLQLANTELAGVVAGAITIGRDSTQHGSGTLTVAAPLTTNAAVNTLTLQAGCDTGSNCAGITQTAGGVITTPSLVLSSNGVQLNLAANAVDNLTAQTFAGGSGVAFTNGKTLSINGSGISAPGQAVAVSSNAALTIAQAVNAGSGNLQLSSGGDLTLANAVSGAAVTLTSNGVLSGSGNVSGSSLNASAVNGITLNTSVASLTASNTSSGNITITNAVPMTLHDVTEGGNGSITIDNTGAMIEAGAVSSGSGAISLLTHSPLTINGSVISSGGGAITLRAGASNSTGDILTINSGATVTSSGPVTLQAGAAINVAQGSTVSPQAVSQPMQNGSLPDINTCISAPATPRCGEVLPPLSSCISAPATLGCSVVLPNLATCIASPAAAGCSVVLPSLGSCMAAPATPGCSAVLPSLASCTASPAIPGCAVVLPTLTACTAAPATPGCSAVLPSLGSCTASPAIPGCSAVLPSLANCTVTPSIPGCAAVLPTLAACVSAPATAGCAAVLPTITTCVSTPDAPGCSVVLPTLASCISVPAKPGCSAVLPGIATCSANPATPGCSVVLPTLASCISAPATPGCGAVLPSLATCSVTPDLPGCSVVLPTLATCTSAPATPGCSAVLPSLASCISNPLASGCSVVLPSLATCSVTPGLPGCSVVLPDLATCSAAPATPGCSAVLPSIATCTTAPATPGCGVILPSLENCTSHPALPGCTAVLPNLATCINNPAAAGCSAVLPNLTACISNPQAPGCTAVLPTLANCTSTPSLPGCSVVLPNLAACISNPAASGCSAVLPTLASCISAPDSAGCGVVLPSLASCAATPSLPGCAVVLPNIADCLNNPAASGCQVVVRGDGNGNNSDFNHALNNTVELVTGTQKPVTQPLAPAGLTTPANADSASAAAQASDKATIPDSKPADSKPDDSKKDDSKKDDAVKVAAKPEAKKEEPARKLYCN